jgi:hypothetical protein
MSAAESQEMSDKSQASVRAYEELPQIFQSSFKDALGARDPLE